MVEANLKVMFVLGYFGGHGKMEVSCEFTFIIRVFFFWGGREKLRYFASLHLS